ncbi:MAG: tripartite tricarboxylate transporter substrate binding protein [Burkholderiales bacterium]|nr:tripartite tricarboxylate transporter substrate binding protein [Burkholderiales bacterium]
MQRRRLLQAALAAAALPAAFPAIVRAQAWPARPIRFIVPYIPGSAPDVLARTLAERLTTALGQTIVIENRGGAGGNIGTELIAKAPADGYTIGLATSAVSTNPWLYRKVGYDPLTDFTYVNMSTAMPHLLVVAADAPQRSTADLVRALKEAPGKLNYASGGNGSGAHLAGELFKGLAAVDAVHVPFKGAPDIVNSVISKTTNFGFPTLVTAVPLVRAGRLRALAVTGTRRNHALPEVPAVADAVPGYELMSWFGIIGPAGMPAEAVRRLDAELTRALAEPAFRDRLQADGSEVVNLGSTDFAARFKADYPKSRRMVELSGAKLD